MISSNVALVSAILLAVGYLGGMIATGIGLIVGVETVLEGLTHSAIGGVAAAITLFAVHRWGREPLAETVSEAHA